MAYRFRLALFALTSLAMPIASNLFFGGRFSWQLESTGMFSPLCGQLRRGDFAPSLAASNPHQLGRSHSCGINFPVAISTLQACKSYQLQFGSVPTTELDYRNFMVSKYVIPLIVFSQVRFISVELGSYYFSLASAAAHAPIMRSCSPSSCASSLCSSR